MSVLSENSSDNPGCGKGTSGSEVPGFNDLPASSAGGKTSADSSFGAGGFT